MLNMADLQQPMTRRKVLGRGVLGLGILSGALLTACGDDTDDAGPAAATESDDTDDPVDDEEEEQEEEGEADDVVTVDDAADDSVADGLTTEDIELEFLGHIAGGDREQEAYDLTLEAWHDMHPNIQVTYNVVPDPDRLARVQARAAGGEAPDVWRHGHATSRLWAGRDLLLDLTDLLPEDYHENFLPSLMATQRLRDRTIGLPHTTDTSSLFYRQDVLDAIGVEPPDSLENSWTWEEFGEICEQLLELGEQPYAFTHNHGSVGRWAGSFLYSAGAQIVNDDFSEVAIDSPEGVHALEFTKGWMENDWVSPGIWDPTNPNESSDEFIRGTAGLALVGQWNITYLDEQIRDQFEWGVTYLIKDQIQTTSLGGTPIVAYAETPHPVETAAFMEFFTSHEMMKMFDEMANYMPTRNDLYEVELEFEVRNDLMQVFHEQMPSLPVHYVDFVGRTYSSGVLELLEDELSHMMFAGQSPEETAEVITSRGNEHIENNPDIEER